ncbi:MAG: RsmE family RNA methyltransferase [Actinomycetota bacterium]
MTAAHFFVDRIDDDVVRITGTDAHHAARALRIRRGEEITVSDGRGRVARARCVGVSADEIATEVMTRETVERALPRVIVFVAVPKAGKLETIAQKLTEVGIDEIRPWFAARSVARWDATKAAARMKRLRTVAREAAMQSRRAWLPEIGEVGSLEDLPDPSVVLHEEATDQLMQVLPTVAPMSFGVVVGPEGGLNPAEVEQLAARGAHPVSLGPLVLRTETAALVGPVLVLAHFQRLG